MPTNSRISLAHAAANRLGVAQVARLGAGKPQGDGAYRPPIFQLLEPLIENRRGAHFISHALIVAGRLHLFKSTRFPERGDMLAPACPPFPGRLVVFCRVVYLANAAGCVIQHPVMYGLIHLFLP